MTKHFMTTTQSAPTGEPPARTADCQFEELADGGLAFIPADGSRHERVLIVRAFPLSAPGGPVAVLNAAGQELLWAESLAAFPPATRQQLADQLAAGEFLPRIEAILSTSRHEPLVWEVATDRGRHRFQLAASDAVVRQPDGSATVTDAAGICYLIPAVRQLDRRSRRLIERLS